MNITQPSGDTVPSLGEVWTRRSDGKAAVRIGRVWPYMGGDLHVRVEPVRGGRWWFAPVNEFVKRYEPADYDGKTPLDTTSQTG